MADTGNRRDAFAHEDRDDNEDKALSQAASSLFGDGFWGREPVNPEQPREARKDD